MKHTEEITARAFLLARRPPPQETCQPCMGRGRMNVAGALRVCPACQGTGRRSHDHTTAPRSMRVDAQ